MQRRASCSRALAAEGPDLIIGHVFDHVAQTGVRAEEVFTYVRPIVGFVALVVTVDSASHVVYEDRVGVGGQQRIPVGTPDDFDHVPACAPEKCFEFLDDLAVATDRAVQPLQIAIDDPGQIVEFLSGGESDRTEGFRFVGLAIAEERPHARFRSVVDASIV